MALKALKTITTLSIAVICLGFSPLNAQDSKNPGADELFEMARKEAFSGKRNGAREKLALILKEHPEYYDAQIFLGRTYSWDGQYVEARKELEAVLQKTPDNLEATQALADVELWSKNYDRAAALVRQGLITHPRDPELLYKQANALYALGKPEEALLSLNHLLSIDPSHKQGLVLRYTINQSKLKFSAGINFGMDLFSRTFNPAQYAAVQLSRRNNWGASTIRFNYAQRFNNTGAQGEMELYPKISKRFHAYINYAYSASELFPTHRAGAEIFSQLSPALDASAGARYMNFDTDTEVLIYTGSIGWHVKKYWFSVRPFITPQSERRTASTILSLRRYLSDTENYIALTGGLGYSPDTRNIQSTTGLSDTEIHILKSQRAGIAWQKTLNAKWIFNINLELSRQELIFDEDRYVMITSSSAGVRRKF